jgi:hypothetical protein
VDISIKKKSLKNFRINKKKQKQKTKTITPPTPVPSPGEKGGGMISYVVCIIKNFIIFKYYNKLHFIFLLQNPFKLTWTFMSFYLYINFLENPK